MVLVVEAGGRLDGRERKCEGVVRQNTTNTSCFERSLGNDLCPLQATAGKPSASFYCKRVLLIVLLTFSLQPRPSRRSLQSANQLLLTLPGLSISLPTFHDPPLPSNTPHPLPVFPEGAAGPGRGVGVAVVGMCGSPGVPPPPPPPSR